jgi:hypothetical protein
LAARELCVPYMELISADGVLVLYVFLCKEWAAALLGGAWNCMGSPISPHTGSLKRRMIKVCHMYDCVCLLYLVCECAVACCC